MTQTIAYTPACAIGGAVCLTRRTARDTVFNWAAKGRSYVLILVDFSREAMRRKPDRTGESPTRLVKARPATGRMKDRPRYLLLSVVMALQLQSDSHIISIGWPRNLVGGWSGFHPSFDNHIMLAWGMPRCCIAHCKNPDLVCPVLF